MAERGKATALKRKQFKTSEERANAVVYRRRLKVWPDQSPIVMDKWNWLPKLRKGGGQSGH